MGDASSPKFKVKKPHRDCRPAVLTRCPSADKTAVHMAAPQLPLRGVKAVRIGGQDQLENEKFRAERNGKNGPGFQLQMNGMSRGIGWDVNLLRYARCDNLHSAFQTVPWDRKRGGGV